MFEGGPNGYWFSSVYCVMMASKSPLISSWTTPANPSSTLAVETHLSLGRKKTANTILPAAAAIKQANKIRSVRFTAARPLMIGKKGNGGAGAVSPRRTAGRNGANGAQEPAAPAPGTEDHYCGID